MELFDIISEMKKKFSDKDFYANIEKMKMKANKGLLQYSSTEIDDIVNNIENKNITESMPWQYRQYKKYLKQHISDTIAAYNWLRRNIPELFEDKSKFNNNSLKDMKKTMKVHDKSKYGKEEISAYNDHFYNKNNVNKEVEKKNFINAWNHHQKTNKHHWQYWVITHADGKSEAIDMPEENIIEMICDWLSFGFKENNLLNFNKWYEKEKKNMILSDNTKKEVERIVELINKRLEEMKYKPGDTLKEDYEFPFKLSEPEIEENFNSELFEINEALDAYGFLLDDPAEKNSTNYTNNHSYNNIIKENFVEKSNSSNVYNSILEDFLGVKNE